MLKTNTKHATSTLPALAQNFDSIDLEKLARETGFIQRKSSKLTGEGFVLSLLQSVCSGLGSLTNVATNLSQILGKGMSSAF